MTTLRMTLKSRPDKDGRYPVLLCISDRGARGYFSTGFSASPKEFDGSKNNGRFIQGRGIPSFEVERKEEDGTTKKYTNKEANDKLVELEKKASEILKKFEEDHTDWSIDQFRAAFVNAPKRERFLTYANDIINRYRQEERFQKADITSSALTSFSKYDSVFSKRTFQDITPKYLDGYKSFCRKKGNSDNTISMYMREIRRIFNLAIYEGVAMPTQYPFSTGKEDGKAKIPKMEPTKTDQYLPMDSLKVLANAQIDDYVLDRTRHLFLFSFYCRGMNWKDMAMLTVDNFYPDMVVDPDTKEVREVLMMQYQRSKTAGLFRIQVTPNIQRELEWFRANSPLYGDYVLPIVSLKVPSDKMDEYLKQVRKRFNHSLQKLAKELNFPESQLKLTIYSARHSFAMAMQNQNKPVEIISQALGHQSVETTKHYLEKFSTTRMAKETDIDLSM